MSTQCTFLLVCDEQRSDWPELVREALSPMGRLHTVAEREAVAAVTRQVYDVVILDAGAVGDERALVVELRGCRPGLRVVVATASPTWRRARDVLREGAADYIRKPRDAAELRTLIAKVLELPGPRAAPAPEGGH